MGSVWAMRPGSPVSANLRCSGLSPIVTLPGAPSNGNATRPDPHGAVLSLAADQVDGRRADKARDEKALRPQIEVVRRAHLLDPAGAHADDAIRHGGRLDLVVGDQDRRDTELLLERLDLGPHGQTERRVEIGERLVEEQELRLLDQGARERHPLLLAARQLARPPLEKLPDMHEIGGGPDAAEAPPRAASS